MKPFLFNAPKLQAAPHESELVAAWDSGVPMLERNAEAARSSWERMAHAHKRLTEAGDALVSAVATLIESGEAVIEASTELRYAAWCARELEYLDEVRGDTLVQELRRMKQARPPESLESLHECLILRDAIWADDLDEVRRCSGVLDDARRRFAAAARCHRLHQRELRVELRRLAAVAPLRRAA